MKRALKKAWRAIVSLLAKMSLLLVFLAIVASSVWFATFRGVPFGIAAGWGAAYAFAVWLLWLSLRILLARLAKFDKLVTEREEGKIKYLIKAGRLVRMVYKIVGKKIVKKRVRLRSGRRKIVYRIVDDPQNRSARQTLFEWIFGVYWIGIPPKEIKRYPFVWTRPMRPTDSQHGEDPHYAVDAEHKMVTRSEVTDYHAYTAVYSILIDKIEIQGVKFNAGTPDEFVGTIQMDIWATLTLVTVNPYRPVMLLNGTWYPHLADGLRGVIADFFSEMDIDDIREMKKAFQPGAPNSRSGARSDLEKLILQYGRSPGGTIQTTGMRIQAFNFGGFDISDDEVMDAIEQRALEQMRAAAAVEKAKGEAQSITLVGDARARAVTALGAALRANPDAAAVERNRAIGQGFVGTEVRTVALGSSAIVATDSGNAPAPTTTAGSGSGSGGGNPSGGSPTT